MENNNNVLKSYLLDVKWRKKNPRNKKMKLLKTCLLKML